MLSKKPSSLSATRSGTVFGMHSTSAGSRRGLIKSTILGYCAYTKPFTTETPESAVFNCESAEVKRRATPALKFFSSTKRLSNFIRPTDDKSYLSSAKNKFLNKVSAASTVGISPGRIIL